MPSRGADVEGPPRIRHQPRGDKERRRSAALPIAWHSPAAAGAEAAAAAAAAAAWG
ncbi:hypothetical protein TSOC_009228 [Tetrabaena socialis]|uniref:Uncharacterized protein n=1 Tax=Tetrabaena socialis TaxID=47790 RepID=A0A2J7ZWE2_9CHLO|nr:hypothetical protein TSOC_009228 [Tetrabaena socialis]|eukprot:PNH04589.1 hypothetical protein TSOC_009228 [Tetrabaena socialis]